MRVLGAMLDLLFPPRCAFCRGFLAKGEGRTCSTCERDLPFCRGEDARQEGEFYSVCISPLLFEDQVRDSIHRYKFQGARCYRHPYATLMAPSIAHQLKGRYDILSWVPVSRGRLRTRGYDQAKILAEAIGRELDVIPVKTLKKVKHTAAQSGLGGRDARSANIAGAYVALGSVAGKRVLLVDDVLTTGSTLSESANALRLAGASEVLAATLARGEGN